MDIATTSGIGRAPSGASYSAAQSQKIANEAALFQELLDRADESKKLQSSAVSPSSAVSANTIEAGRFAGEYTEGFANSFDSPADKNALAQGDARNAPASQNKTIDKTSKLYEKSLEMESFFVKIMLQSMRQTVSKTNLAGSENEFARNMYEDMLYDQYTEALTKKAGFGLADQIYLELA